MKDLDIVLTNYVCMGPRLDSVTQQRKKVNSLDLVSVFWSGENIKNKLKKQQCFVLPSMSHRYPVRTYTLSPNTGISAKIIFNIINPERQCLSILL